MSEAPRRIIVIKRPVIAAGHHGGAWKIAFADFMTAMFALFLVLWLIATASKAQLRGIAEQFKMPLKVALTGGSSSSTSSSVIPGGGSDPSRAAGEVRPESEPEKDAQDASRLESLKKKLDSMIDSSPTLKQFRPQLLIDITAEGLRIQIVDSNNRPMFDRSSAVVASSMRAILRELGPVLNAQPNKIMLSGHTDATQYSHGDKSYSNWELSSDRANASRRELITGGMDDGRVLRVTGVAASVHLNKDDPYAATNRRISIVVLNHRTQAEIESANSARPTPGVKPAGAAAQSATDKPVAGQSDKKIGD